MSIDFERDTTARSFFTGDLDIPAICEKLEMRQPICWNWRG